MGTVLQNQQDVLIDLIYQIPTDPNAWDKFAKILLDILDASYVHLQAIDFSYNVLSFSHGMGNLAREFYAQAELNYLRFPPEADPRWPVFLNPQRKGWYQCHTHVTEEFVQTSDLYQLILLPIGLRYVASHELMRDEKLCIFWSVSTTAKRKPLNADELHFLDALNIHLRRMVTVQRHKFEFEVQSIAGYALIDKLPQPIMLLNLSGQVVHSNQAMHRIMQQGDVLRIHPHTKMLQLAEPFHQQLEQHFYHIEFLLRRQISDQLLNECCIQLTDEQGEVAYLFLNLLVSAQEKLIFGTRPLVMLTLYQPQNNEYHSQLFKIFDCFSTGVILLTQDQKVFYQNVYASQLLEKSSLLNVSQKQTLRAHGEFQNKLNKLLIDALVNDSGQDHNLVIYGQDQKEILTLNISAIDQNTAYEQIGAGPKVLAVFFKQLNQKRNLEAQYLKQLYQLTPREIQICMHFFQGLDLSEIAEVSHLTISTVRTYLKQIYLKTHCSSQSELMKLLMNAVIG